MALFDVLSGAMGGVATGDMLHLSNGVAHGYANARAGKDPDMMAATRKLVAAATPIFWTEER